MITGRSEKKIVIIGAGIGGLTTAALLARAGLDVTVLEAHIYPGGCAGTFYHQKYNFDAGATLAAGFYPGGPMDIVANAVGIVQWPAHASDLAMMVHLPNGQRIARHGNDERWEIRERAFGKTSETFWRWQERTADALWNLALRMPAWPPQTLQDLRNLLTNGTAWLGSDLRTHLSPALLADLLRPVAAHLGSASRELRLFVDAQLLIASQATSTQTNALYGASALDLPRRGVVHLEGGIGAIAHTLAQAVRDNGCNVQYRQEVRRIVMQNGVPTAVETKRGESIPADIVVANLPPWNIARLLGSNAPRRLRNLPPMPNQGGGAFMVYVGLDAAVIPVDFPLHHQVIMREPMGEGNTVFLSLSPEWDIGRAPAGKRALTISTHTQLDPWWRLAKFDNIAYQRHKQLYTERLLDATEVAIPGVRESVDLIKAGTPVTFQRFTRRDWGWVGGFPQTDLFRAWGPRIGPNVWMVGDTIFPGQSTAAVALGGLRVANALLAQMGRQPVRTSEHFNLLSQLNQG